MKNNVLMILLLSMNIVKAQSRTGFEAYYYSNCSGYSAVSPRVYYQDRHGWYGETRCNYEKEQTFSLYAGRTFAREDSLSWSVTPLAGVLTGSIHGGSLGIVAGMDYRRISFYTTSQYIASSVNRNDNFFFSWSELGYQLSHRFYAGVVLQQTAGSRMGGAPEPGIQLNIAFGDWLLPVYLFSPTA